MPRQNDDPSQLVKQQFPEKRKEEDRREGGGGKEGKKLIWTRRMTECSPSMHKTLDFIPANQESHVQGCANHIHLSQHTGSVLSVPEMLLHLLAPVCLLLTATTPLLS